MFGFWLALVEGTLLGFDAQRVIALRAMKIAAGGSSARSEVSRMVTEKVSAGAEAVAILTTQLLNLNLLFLLSAPQKQTSTER